MTQYLIPERLPEGVSSGSGIDASRAMARKSVRREVGLAFRLGSVELAVGQEKLFPSFNIAHCDRLKRERRNFELMVDIRHAAVYPCVNKVHKFMGKDEHITYG